jgi:hypothetical protein
LNETPSTLIETIKMCDKTLADAFIGIMACVKIMPFIHYLFAKCIASNKEVLPEDLVERGGHMSEDEIEAIFSNDISLWRFFSMYSHLSIIFTSPFLNLLLNNNICIGSYDSYSLEIFCYVVLPIDVLIILIEIVMSNERKYLENLSREGSLFEYLKQLIKTKPSISMSVECYHYETHIESYTTTDSEGNTETNYRTVTVRVHDHTYHEEFRFAYWEDVSLNPETLPLEKFQITRIILTKSITFGDSSTASQYERQVNSMLETAKREYPGSHHSYSRIDNIPGFKTRLASYWDAYAVKWWMNSGFFLFFSLIGLTWPYRLAFNKSTQKSAFNVSKKVFYLNPTENALIY